MIGVTLNIVKDVLKGVISGGLASFIGYIKGEEVPKWDLEKALKTTIIGAVTAGIISGTGLPLSEVALEIALWLDIPVITNVVVEMAILTGIVMVTDQLVKVIVRRTDIQNAWNKVKGFLAKYF